MRGMHTDISKVADPAQVSSFKLKFVHGNCQCSSYLWLAVFQLTSANNLTRLDGEPRGARE
jgi:hypothetical protein